MDTLHLVVALPALLLSAPALAPAEEPPPGTVELTAEYRVRTLFIDSLELSGNAVEGMDWTEQRLRLESAFRHQRWLAIRTRIDVLDGVLFGDNGRFGGVPSPNSGVSLATKRPNNTTVGVGLIPGADPVDGDSYVPRLRGVEPVEVDQIYGEVVLPIGLLRVGRQPMVEGAMVGGHDGSRINRWGVSSYSDTADRFLFGTKIDEAIRALIRGPGYTPDTSMDRGVILALWVDLFSQGDLSVAGDTLRQQGAMVIWKDPEGGGAGGPWRDFDLRAASVYLSGDDVETNLFAFPTRASVSIGPVDVLFQGVLLRGESREIAEGFAALSQRKAAVQDLRAAGGQAVIDWHLGRLTLTFEGDYATGDADPRAETPITSFSFPRDLNVGLLLFEHIIAFESARSAAVGIENLASLDARSFPLTEVSTEGRFTNAVALFPQVKYDWIRTGEHRLHTRLGALFAWPDAGVVDPVQTILAEDGDEIADDAVNFHGGSPGSYYGTELDLQIEWAFRSRFIWTVEAAVLFPGDALEDENGDAINAFFAENRFVFLF